MSEQTSMVAPPAAGAGVVAAGELAAVLALATAGALDATGWLAADALGDAVGDAASAWVSVAIAACVGVLDVAFDFVAGLHAADDNATTTMTAAVDSARTCMAAPCLDGRRRALPPNRS
jgi:hypothetical protein